MESVRSVTRVGHLVRTYGLDALIAVLALQSMAALVLRRDAEDAPGTTLWFTLSAVAAMVLPLFARGRFPFGAPALYWLLAAALALVGLPSLAACRSDPAVAAYVGDTRYTMAEVDDIYDELETRLTKNEILKLYLDRAYMGGGAFGVDQKIAVHRIGHGVIAP